MRIISGQCKGRKLSMIPGWDIRPTSDRVREAIFNIIGRDVKGKIVLDLFAGSGAFGLEALSRGALYAFFIDNSYSSFKIVEKNASICNFTDKFRFIRRDILKLTSLRSFMDKSAEIVFMDPPYKSGLINKTLKHPALLECLSDDALIIAEHSVKEEIDNNLSELEITDQRKYGKTFVTFLRKTTANS